MFSNLSNLMGQMRCCNETCCVTKAGHKTRARMSVRTCLGMVIQATKKMDPSVHPLFLSATIANSQSEMLADHYVRIIYL